MTFTDEMYPQAWDVLTDDERRTVATLTHGHQVPVAIVTKLARYSQVFHVQWSGANDNGAWDIADGFQTYVTNRLAAETDQPTE